MFKKELIIDGSGHLLGRLASVVAKEILNGQHVVCIFSIFTFFLYFIDRPLLDARVSTSRVPFLETP
jgi:hypothetical protein